MTTVTGRRGTWRAAASAALENRTELVWTIAPAVSRGGGSVVDSTIG